MASSFGIVVWIANGIYAARERADHALVLQGGIVPALWIPALVSAGISREKQGAIVTVHVARSLNVCFHLVWIVRLFAEKIPRGESEQSHRGHAKNNFQNCAHRCFPY